MPSVEEIAFLTRMGERLLAVLIGGLCVVLGYLLFTKLPDKTDSEGKLVLPGGVNIWLSRVGPGVFFALFGAVIVGVSFRSPIESVSHMSDVSHDAAGGSKDVKKTQELRGMASGSGAAGSAPEQEQRLTEARTQIYTLNHDWPQALRPDLHPQDRKVIEVARDYSKQQILRAVWLENWGSFVDFEKWVNSGATLPPPTALRRDPVEIYFAGKEVSQ